ncbi:hypothetical protein BAX97_13840 [Elizabethkingia meningoseptica]|uniref:hypothetical protein n=1 Tax=Elizabethkingia meningoseptica TaxID=238 RepID=UPI000332C03F|nr:hypothetical protein [Elizabethkingia meningoseptica]AQX05547.1 hypothetical protein BBD33_09945 [Elizabethkingia meningoseptica]AQX47592.1 hypothetical protein B5G46_09935 [Elizabethkingia meningoseptica]EOR30417.1 hypothetical protein L100_06532 [Elizabethkingia meningoseptica ATCC 13253 = NBRC 12535]KUY24142.1 hypothetical protein ATB99_01175 [Elizabethkingia meningoseptica]MDE5489678.1 hypothetical protein [Elizabethkingia meningoseptica]
MFTFLLYSIVLFMAVFWTKAQQMRWEQINSHTVEDLMLRQNIEKNSNSNTNTIQIGDYNEARLILNAQTDIQVKQTGDYNSLYYINSFTDTETKTSVITRGDNNIVDITGSNSISKDMMLNVKGDNMIVFMRNY